MAVYAVTYDSKSSYITNGKRYRVERDDGRGLFNIRSNRGTMLTCLWEGCAHLGSRGNWTRIEEEEQVTLRPGDYVSTEGMTEETYHAVARAFMAAGAGRNYSMPMRRKHNDYMMWSKTTGNVDAGPSLHPVPNGRHLTPAQVIGAVNAGNQQEETMDNDFKLKCILHSAQTYLDEEREELERSDFHKVKAMQKRDRHDEMMQRARDMLPDGWRLARDGEPEADMADPANWREGDVIEALVNGLAYTKGRQYKITGFDRDGDPRFKDDDGDNMSRYAYKFRFHRRPT